MSTSPINGTITNLWRAQSARLDGEAYEVTPHLACLPLSIVNVYLYGHPGSTEGGWVLIDAGLPSSHTSILEAAKKRFGAARPAAIILTHGHFDHVGALRALLSHWDVPVFAHRLELPYLTGRSSYPPPDPAVGGGLMSFLSRLYPRGPIDVRPHIHALPDDGSIPGMPRWRWIHTPGHCTGHISLFLDEMRLLVTGNAFVTQAQESLLGVLTQSPKVRRPPAYYTTDWPAARQSNEALSRLRPEIAATGHGLPMVGAVVGEQLASLLDHWEDHVPHEGRYVRKPAKADESGVRAKPPPVFDPHMMTAVALGGRYGGWTLNAQELRGRRRRLREYERLATISMRTMKRRFRDQEPFVTSGFRIPTRIATSQTGGIPKTRKNSTETTSRRNQFRSVRMIEDVEPNTARELHKILTLDRHEGDEHCKCS